ncbi:urease accessory protein UreD [Tranquillimonas alkanivorans]|uniref:Urease accessory protein UreD n=1 Tax=Tranquillimonas alkanivorans TaxID=441119 RepID=A0A1I5R6Z5_9RHOB|nr:urease accessory protein UreD [Tranquillimonas alkanivorans]SFP54308.1 urease accessory protein [Tranquillimonas alkanivorans]
MFDQPQQVTMQRARGRAAVALSARAGRTALDRLHQSGSAKAMLPRCHGPVPEVVFLNTAGGITGGDRLEYALDLGAGARAVATTQTAERVYASSGGAGAIDVAMKVGTGARLHWMPQETILFDRAALDRRTTISLEGDASCLVAETLVLGRAAMGEIVRTLDATDRRRVTRDGIPVLAEPIRLTSDVLARDDAAGLSGAKALATVALVAPGAEDAMASVRRLLEVEGVDAAASAWDGKCVVRMMAREAWPLRRLVARVLVQLGQGPLPRVWQT